MCTGGRASGSPAFRAFYSPAHQPREPRLSGRLALAIGLLFTLFCSSLLHAQTAPGTVIRNSAQANYSFLGGPRQSQSNEVALTVQAGSTPSALSLLRATPGTTTTTASTGPTQCLNNGAYQVLAPARLLDGTTIDPAQAAPLQVAPIVHGDEPLFVRLVDPDQNHNSTLRDSVDVQLQSASGDRERLRLTETAADSGEFVGYIPTSTGTVALNDCVLQVLRDESITGTYADPQHPTDTSAATALVDPYGLVFDSRSGAAVNGARVHLVDAVTGADAVVLGDDGRSRYPAALVTGNAVTDSGGTTYNLPAGVYRFPLVAPGQYRLVITPPAGYAFPSTVLEADLQLLSGAPYRISTGSYGNSFVALAPPAAAIDVPLDPSGTALFLQKSSSVTTAVIGDFVQYTLVVENAPGAGAFRGTTVTDQLPAGLRYQASSTRIDNVVAADPLISADGSQLSFNTGRLESGARRTIRYVVEITTTARARQLVNRARATAQEGVVSNDAQAAIVLRDDMFRDAGIIMGRVVQGRCEPGTENMPGVVGVRVYLEDGRYAITDKEGKYHFEGVPPGAHVTQLDTTTVPAELEPAPCEQRVRHAGRAYSQFVELRGGTLWRADFRLAVRAPPTGDVELRLDSSAVSNTLLAHQLSVRVGKVGVTGLRARIMLPEGLAYQPGSALLGDTTLADPAIDSGVATFLIGAVDPGQAAQLHFRTALASGGGGATSIKAMASFATAGQLLVNTPVVSNDLQRENAQFASEQYQFTPRFDVLKADLKPADRAQLDALAAQWHGVRDIQLRAVGHTDNQQISAANRGLYRDNYALSEARANAVAAYLKDKLGLADAAVTTAGKGPDEPLNAGKDAASMALNRRVEISISGQRQQRDDALHITRDSEVATPVAVAGSWKKTSTPSGEATPVRARELLDADPAIDTESLDGTPQWFWPVTDAHPSIPSIKVAIAHATDQTVELLLNGAAVSPLNFDGISQNARGTGAVSHWRGVDLENGANLLLARVRNADGSVAVELTRTVHYGDGAVRAELVRASSQLVADGTTRPVLVLQLYDRYGKPARAGTLGSYSVDAPYKTWWEVRSLQENQLLATGDRRPTFEVDRNGQTRIELEPTAQAGTALLRLRFNERVTQEVRAWLEPQARDWILVGIASGTAAHTAISGNMTSAAEAGIEEGYADNGRAAFFAKGAVKGKVLLTLAYDSGRDRALARERLLGTIEPDRYYTVYGDASEQRFEAASAEKLYLKLERSHFYALFGDFETGLTVTELSRYNRTLTGFKSEYAGDRYAYSAFATQTSQGFARDDIQGDGTSGLYQLRRQRLLINTDKVRIEVRDRLHIERVIETRTLARYLDYSIDYLSGTIFLHQPLASRDQDFNPQFIVAEYEVEGGTENLTAGGRAAVKLANNKLELGTTLLSQGADAGDTRLGGVDLRWDQSDSTHVRAELAHSKSDDPSRAPQADAWLAEIQHVTEKFEARAYVREQQSGFGLDQLSTLDGGTRRTGFDGRLKLGKLWSVRAEAARQDLLATEATRTQASAELRRENQHLSLSAGLRHVEDHTATGQDNTSDLGTMSGSVDLWQDRLRLRASQELALAGHDASTDFPARSLVGADYRITRDTTLFTDYEHSNGAQLQSDMTRVGVRARPWERAQLQSSIGQQFTENGARTFSTLGLTQGWQPNEHWTVDAGVDQSRTLRGVTLQPFNSNVPLASGSLDTDFTAMFVGALYRSQLWTYTTRIEHRLADSEQRWLLTSGFYRERVQGHAFSLAASLLDNQARNGGADSNSSSLRFAWAYRPVSSSWIVLDRFDVKFERSGLAATRLSATRLIDNFNANWQVGATSQLGLQLAARYTRTSFDNTPYDGYSSLEGFDYRRDLSARFDVGAHGTLLQSWHSGVSEHAVGLDLGMTVARNVWLALGYNVSGLSDTHFEANRYTARGPYLNFRIKLDQDTFKDLSLAALHAPR
jgi:uncharacterized repeat protein (TIGR01451 family)